MGKILFGKKKDNELRDDLFFMFEGYRDSSCIVISYWSKNY